MCVHSSLCTLTDLEKFGGHVISTTEAKSTLKKLGIHINGKFNDSNNVDKN
jgi:hypothetical protein